MPLLAGVNSLAIFRTWIVLALGVERAFASPY